MSKILLTADSWGIGVFDYDANGDYGPVGTGIYDIFAEHGHDVVNISQSGGSNWLMVDRLNGIWGDTGKCVFGTDAPRIDFDWEEIDYVMFMQTDIFREHAYYANRIPSDPDSQSWHWLTDTFVEHLLTFNTLNEYINDYFEKLYTALNYVGEQRNQRILCVGGWSKLHPMIKDYPNLVPVISSCPEFLIPNFMEDTYISGYEFFVNLSENKKFVEHFGDEFKKLAINVTEKFHSVCAGFGDPHPRLDGYRRIANEILPYLL